MLVGKDKRKALEAKALEREKAAKLQKQLTEKKSQVDQDPGNKSINKSMKSNMSIMDETVSADNTMAEIEKEIENKDLA